MIKEGTVKPGQAAKTVSKKDDNNPLKQIDTDLWNVEIDLENVNDLIRRIENDRKPGFTDKLKSLFPSLF